MKKTVLFLLLVFALFLLPILASPHDLGVAALAFLAVVLQFLAMFGAAFLIIYSVEKARQRRKQKSG